MLKIQCEVLKDQPVAVLTLDGRLVWGEESNRFRTEVRALAVPPRKAVVVNLKNLTYFDGAGLGTLIACFHAVRGQKLRMILCEVQPKFLDVFQELNLKSVFEIHNTREAAIKSALAN